MRLFSYTIIEVYFNRKEYIFVSHLYAEGGECIFEILADAFSTLVVYMAFSFLIPFSPHPPKDGLLSPQDDVGAQQVVLLSLVS